MIDEQPPGHPFGLPAPDGTHAFRGSNVLMNTPAPPLPNDPAGPPCVFPTLAAGSPLAAAATPTSDPSVAPEINTGSAADDHGIHDRLMALRDAAPSESPESLDDPHANRLAVARLGMAAALYYSLRAKHPATAARSLRVAISCSAWCERMGMAAMVRDRIEIAGLLHDIGKIGIPDRILRKPGRLTSDEKMTMDLSSRLGMEILSGCTSDQELLSIIEHRYRWFDSRRADDEGPVGEAIPMGSRMLAIAGAFDAMTTDTVYRPALSREAALNELFSGSGTQFDPTLVDDFVRMLEDRPELLQHSVAKRWLTDLANDPSTSWSAQAALKHATDNSLDHDVLQHWLKQTGDGVVMLDSENVVVNYNARMSELTGVQPDAVLGQHWNNDVVGLQNAHANSHTTVVPSSFRCDGRWVDMTICRGNQTTVPVRVQLSEVLAADKTTRGTLMIFRDRSEADTMRQEIDSLHRQTVTDSLTGAANRGHLDETLTDLVRLSDKSKHTFSVVICDIDHFKKINDVHGHQAGDEALVRFTKILQDASREGDLVARYGGEEFVVLMPSCDIAAATRLAEQIRTDLESTPLPMLGNQCITASFGVTEYQSGDTSEIIVARADRALLKAKDNGRNRVVQIGSGDSTRESSNESKSTWLDWFRGGNRTANREFDIVTPVPADLVIEKLRGFVADHNAEIVRVAESQLTLKLRTHIRTRGRRRSDHSIDLKVSLTLSPRRDPDNPEVTLRGTNVHCELEPVRQRDRRDAPLQSCYRRVSDSLRSYLIGEFVH